MIWYAIASGRIDPSSLPKGVRLAATYTNLHELASSHKLYRSPVEVKRAAKAIVDYSYTIELQDPFHFIASLVPGASPGTTMVGGRLWVELKKMISIPDAKLSDWVNKFGNSLKGYIDNFTREVKRLTDHINNDLLPLVRASIASSNSDEQMRQQESAKTQRAVINQWVQMVTGTSLPKTFDWKQLELMLGASAQFNTTLELTPGMKMRMNDWHDFLNMAYVAPGKLYWTQERRWISYIKKAGFNFYLFTK